MAMDSETAYIEEPEQYSAGNINHSGGEVVVFIAPPLSSIPWPTASWTSYLYEAAGSWGLCDVLCKSSAD
jgi:hypothetical protein